MRKEIHLGGSAALASLLADDPDLGQHSRQISELGMMSHAAAHATINIGGRSTEIPEESVSAIPSPRQDSEVVPLL